MIIIPSAYAQVGGGTVGSSNNTAQFGVDCPFYMKNDPNTGDCKLWWNSVYVAIPLMIIVITIVAIIVFLILKRKNNPI